MHAASTCPTASPLAPTTRAQCPSNPVATTSPNPLAPSPPPCSDWAGRTSRRTCWRGVTSGAGPPVARRRPGRRAPPLPTLAHRHHELRVPTGTPVSPWHCPHHPSRLGLPGDPNWRGLKPRPPTQQARPISDRKRARWCPGAQGLPHTPPDGQRNLEGPASTQQRRVPTGTSSQPGPIPARICVPTGTTHMSRPTRICLCATLPNSGCSDSTRPETIQTTAQHRRPRRGWQPH